jgi:hypothetical protein
LEAFVVYRKAALTCPTKLGVNVTTNCVLCPAANVRGRFKVLLILGSVRTAFEMVTLPEPSFVIVMV